MNFAPRKGLDIPSGTPANVGPNSYMVSYPCCKYRTNNYAPFLSFTQRKSIKSDSYTDAIYDPPSIRSKIKYGNSLQYTAPRVTMDIKEDPPPREEMRSAPYILNLKPKPNPGKLYMCRVPFTKGTSAPTIPGHKDSNGYDITEENDLIKIPADDHDNTLGPAFYSVPSGEVNFNSIRYKGCRWSKAKGQRSKLCTNDNPGPGEYEVDFVKCIRRKDNEKFKELMRKCCNVPRYTCQLICRSKNEGLPGPGYYEIVDIDKIGELKNLSLKPRPFIDSTERFIYKAEVGPGPQQYNVCDCFKHRKDFSIKDVPFLGDSLRFPIKKQLPTPDPGQYEVDGIKCNRAEGKKASFNSTAERKLLEVNNTNPGPGEYSVPMKGPRCCPQEEVNRNSVFSSMTCRFRRHSTENEPDPASYGITQAYKYINDKHSHATGRRVPFGTSEPKFSKIYDFAGVLKGIDSPSVGEYDVPAYPKSYGKTIPIADRFPFKAPDQSPGPQAYTLHPVVGEAMYRGKTTHNARLMKNVMKKIVVKPPKKKKKPQPRKDSLDWFEIEEESSTPPPSAPLKK